MIQNVTIPVNVRPAFFSMKAFFHNAVAISLIKLLHHTV